MLKLSAEARTPLPSPAPFFTCTLKLDAPAQPGRMGILTLCRPCRPKICTESRAPSGAPTVYTAQARRSVSEAFRKSLRVSPSW